ncbi:MAG: hypothetical protein K1000chlam2_01619 [Chlamydiae bacterium]|nr:hypothetical protein [Chlamydiota bacterium]
MGMRYEINLTFLWLASSEQAVKRVAQRVKQGGHHIPKETIIRRYYLGIKNLVSHYLPLVDTANILNNSSEKSEMMMIARKNRDDSLDILDDLIWKKLEEVAHE